jgi:hypothetical protein
MATDVQFAKRPRNGVVRDTILITAVTLGELSFGPHATEDPIKRAGRVAVLQQAGFERIFGCPLTVEGHSGR